ESFQLGDGIVGSALQARQAELINDVLADPRAKVIAGTADDEAERLLVAPLIAHDELIGGMAVWRPVPSDLYTEGDLDLLVGLSQQAGVRIDQSRLSRAAETH